MKLLKKTHHRMLSIEYNLNLLALNDNYIYLYNIYILTQVLVYLFIYSSILVFILMKFVNFFLNNNFFHFIHISIILIMMNENYWIVDDYKIDI